MQPNLFDRLTLSSLSKLVFLKSLQPILWKLDPKYVFIHIWKFKFSFELPLSEANIDVGE